MCSIWTIFKRIHKLQLDFHGIKCQELWKSSISSHTKLSVVVDFGSWGHGEWTGDWSDNSKKWTPALRKALNVQRADDGIFWMDFRSFITYFSSVDICRHQENWHQMTLRDSFNGVEQPRFMSKWVFMSSPNRWLTKMNHHDVFTFERVLYSTRPVRPMELK